ncbi:hypothetical protein CANARDRAFT_180295, partial [[Candida] arabinofermentans NRRL YB-2248]
DDDEQSDSELLNESRLEQSKVIWYKRPSIYMIALFLFSFAVGDGISITSELTLIIQAICKDLNNNLTNCSSSKVQMENTNLQKWMNFTSGLVKAIVSTKLGKLSDLYGRKPIMLYTLSCTILTKLSKLIILNPNIFTFRKWLLLLVNLIDAFGGSIFVFLGIANSYLIDVIDEKYRTQYMGIMIAFLYFGLGFGPLFGSILPFEPIGILKCGFIVLSLTFIITLFWFPESRSFKLLKKTRRLSTISERQKKLDNNTGYSFNFFSSLKLLWITRLNRDGSIDHIARFNVLLLVLIDILVSSCTVGLGLVIVLYSTFQFNWNANDLGIFIGLAMLMKSTVLLLFNPWFNKKLSSYYKTSNDSIDKVDYISLILCGLMELIGAIIMTLATNSKIFLSSILFSSFGSLSTPVLHSTILKYNSNSDKNGEFFGVLAFIRNLINLIAPLIGLTVYSWSLNHDVKLVFYIMIGTLTVSLFL